MAPLTERDGRYAALTSGLVDAVLTTPGHTSSDLRRAVFERARSLAERGRAGGGGGGGATADGVPAPLAGYVDTVALHAYRVIDEDVAALQRAGNSDDALFEVTVSAALGAALGRLERGLAALASPPDPLSTSWRGGTQEPD